MRKSILFYFLLLRIASVFIVKTSYVPDEYWQSLEVAHRVVFGYGYLTWEWLNGLRCYLYPAIFSTVYKGLQLCHLDYRALLIILPRVLQATMSAIGDVYTVKIARELYGERAALWTLRSLLVSWFLFYCGSRTLTNTMETSLTCIAFFYYPCIKSFLQREKRCKPSGKDAVLFLSLAALTVVIRPTSIVLWAPLCLFHVISEKATMAILKSYALVGTAAFFLMLLVDRLFYGRWVCALFNFVHFNVLSGQGAFYGAHPFHWYLSQGFPVIMATHLVPFLLEVCRKWKSPLLAMIAWQLLVYSFISHKEFRFILPVLPMSMCVVGKYLASAGKKARLVYVFLVVTNVPLMVYCGLIHQRAPLDSISHLAESVRAKPSSSVLFLMPCHSVPLYSHLHVNISTRFLTCEPNLNAAKNYVDEADAFFADQGTFLTSQYGNLTSDKLPSHVVMFDNLAKSAPVSHFLQHHAYKLDAQYFHSHFFEGRLGKFVNIYMK